MKPIHYGLILATLGTASMQITAPSYAQSVAPPQSSAPNVDMLPTAPLSQLEPSTATPPAALPAEDPTGTLKYCMSIWDPGTHMSKSEWMTACKRTLNGQQF